MKIVLGELENLCNATLIKLENIGVAQIYISEDYYWVVFFSDACNPIEKPEAVMGSLFADWEWLEKVLRKENPMTNIDFYRIGNIITAIGNEFDKPPHEPASNDLLVKVSDIKQLFDLIFTGAQKENINLEVIDTLFEQYWRVDLASIYDIYISGEPPIRLQQLPSNIPALTEKMMSSSKLGISDFEQVGVIFKAIGYAPEGVLFMFIDTENENEKN